MIGIIKINGTPTDIPTHAGFAGPVKRQTNKEEDHETNTQFDSH